MKTLKFRHEKKHYINISDYYSIKNRLKYIASTDKFAGNDGTYKIRSLYFDTPGNKALVEKLESFNNREKFRIRLYNNDPSYIKLEKKSKTNGLCLKRSAPLTREQCEQLISGDIAWLVDSKHELLVELYAKMKHQLLKPKTVVDYKREAYIYEPGNIRITIDSDIRSGLFSKDLLNPTLPTIGIIYGGYIVLEVKFDEFLPQIIQDIIQTNQRRSTAISKYAACRMYG
ncbi:polyphosphate polymerase domain-containing protein [Desulfoscipio gibsoniae]|uniref:VTC domain-containing protein n=1 Tax=Desulfoscipio gibsoniae DSM 7213 TaxID=767817 RepID=R4KBI8_9FIRM|nr:VTC domain-containing protein [Desulfoscipio gibsoniae DSM 7213]